MSAQTSVGYPAQKLYVWVAFPFLMDWHFLHVLAPDKSSEMAYLETRGPLRRPPRWKRPDREALPVSDTHTHTVWKL